MLAKVNKRKRKSSFSALLDYVTDSTKAVFIETRNVISLETAATEMAATAAANYRSVNPGYHFVLAWPEAEKPSHVQAVDAAEHALDALGMTDNQAVIVGHGNTQHFHVHVVVNRINPNNGLAITTPFDYFVLDKACREIELKQGWSWGSGVYRIVEVDRQPVILNQRTSQTYLTQGARTAERRTGLVSLQRQVQQEAKPILEKAKDWDDLHRQLATIGLAYELYGKGAVFRQADGKTCKASRAGSDFGLGNMESQFGEFQPSIYALEPTPEQAIRSRFHQEQRQRKAERETRKQELQQEQVRALAKLSEAQRAERAQVVGMGWRGNGDALCAVREIMAETHKQQRKHLRHSFRQRLHQLKVHHSTSQQHETTNDSNLPGKASKEVMLEPTRLPTSRASPGFRIGIRVPGVWESAETGQKA